MTAVIVIRPQPGCQASVAAACAAGLDAHGFALFEVRAVDWDPPDPATVDALLIGSANALRHGGEALARYRGKPAYVVGEATAEAARRPALPSRRPAKAASRPCSTASSGRALACCAWRAGPRRLAPPEGVRLVERIVYASDPLPMSADCARLLAQGAVVMLHSAEAARHFAGQCDAHGIARGRVELAALGPRIAEAAGQGWAAIAASERPTDHALLALARDLCQTGRETQG